MKVRIRALLAAFVLGGAVTAWKVVAIGEPALDGLVMFSSSVCANEGFGISQNLRPMGLPMRTPLAGGRWLSPAQQCRYTLVQDSYSIAYLMLVGRNVERGIAVAAPRSVRVRCATVVPHDTYLSIGGCGVGDGALTLTEFGVASDWGSVVRFEAIGDIPRMQHTLAEAATNVVPVLEKEAIERFVIGETQ